MKKKLIFISGTGRSGTHYIGRLISSHPDIDCRMENPETFKLITKIATTQDFSRPIVIYFLKRLLFFRLHRILKNSPLHILEKSHPSIWLADEIIHHFNNAFFIGIYRDVEPTVNSMLAHRGVLSWYSKLPQNQVNRFLGINENNKETFNKLPIEEKCALRWLSHKNELNHLQSKYPDKVMTVKYENLLSSPESIMLKIADFLDLKNQFKLEQFKTASLDKWKESLNQDQVDSIQSAIQNANT